MQVIPAVNAFSFQEAQKQVSIIKSFLPKGRWVHFDVSDGKFTKAKNWHNLSKLPYLKLGDYNLEIHLMVQKPLIKAVAWLKKLKSIKPTVVNKKRKIRIIIPFEFIAKSGVKNLEEIRKKHKEIEIALSVPYEVKKVKLIPYLVDFKYFQVLAVPPGRSKQQFRKTALKVISFLEQKAPNAKIEVDGGINPSTAGLAKQAGADVVVSASYILNSNNPQDAYKALSNV